MFVYSSVPAGYFCVHSSTLAGWKWSTNQLRACRSRVSRRISYKRSIKFTSSYVMLDMGWLLALSLGSGKGIGGFGGILACTCQFDALDAGERYTALLQFHVNPAPKFARNFVLSRRCGARLEANERRRAAERLHAKYSRAIDESL